MQEALGTKLILKWQCTKQRTSFAITSRDGGGHPSTQNRVAREKLADFIIKS